MATISANVIGVGTTINDGTGDPLRTAFTKINANFSQLYSAAPDVLGIAVSDEITPLVAGTGKATFRIPYACTIIQIRGSLSIASTSGKPTINIKKEGLSILSTMLTFDENERTTTTASVPLVISDSACADDAEITIDISSAGTGAAGLKLYFTILRNA
jgi:hypothetical protein